MKALASAILGTSQMAYTEATILCSIIGVMILTIAFLLIELNLLAHQIIP